MNALKAEDVKSEDASEFQQSNIIADTSSAEAAIRARLARKRTKTGCLTCRRRRIKCDEGKPICRNCQKSRRQCEGYNQRVVFKPADFQYLGPHGAATITFHTSMLPGVTGAPPDEQLSYGQPELRPRIIDPQGYDLQQGAQGYHHSGDSHTAYASSYTAGPLQNMDLGFYNPQQHWNMSSHSQGLPYGEMNQPGTQTHPFMPLHPVQMPIPTVAQGAIASNMLPQNLIPIPPQSAILANYEPPPPLPFQWNQIDKVPQTMLEHRAWHPESDDRRAGAQWQSDSARITISQTKTTTTIHHDLPLARPIERPEPTRASHHKEQEAPLRSPSKPTPKFLASQLYEQSAKQDPETAGPPYHQVHGGNAAVANEGARGHELVSPARFLEEAAIEQHDDDYWDVDQGDDVELEISAKILEQKRHGLLKSIVDMTGHHASVLDLRGFDTFIYDGILDSYRPEWAANPLKNPSTARVFAHFIAATGPLLTIFVRQTRVSSALLHDGPLPLNQQGLWTYIMPMAALHHQGLLQAILAISSLHIAKLQHASETPSFKHYGYALKRIHRSVRNPDKRNSAATLAATLLLGYYEIVAANHTNWNTHLAGAKQLVIETDFAGMTKEFRQMKADKTMRDSQNPYYMPDMPPLPYNSHPYDALLDQIPDTDEGVVSIFAGKGLKYDEYGRIIDQSSDDREEHRKSLDLVNYETLKDLFWWYCKQDVYQSIISGNPLMMDFAHWTDCPPRAPLNKADAVYGSFDHLMILLARIADFTVRDRSRKLKVIRASGGWKPFPGRQMGGPARAPSGARPPDRMPPNGSERTPFPPPPPPPPPPQVGAGQTASAPIGVPFFGMAPAPPGSSSMPASYKPTDDWAHQTPSPSSSHSDGPQDLAAATEQAVQEWEQIKAAADFFASQLGPMFQPLGPEYQQPQESPFGPVLFYRSWDISCLWAIYNLCLIILIRGHPHMPPAAHMAAGVAAHQTLDIAITIARIAAGVPVPPADQPLNPNLAASLCDLTVPLFFAGIQYQTPEQRVWLLDRLYSVDYRAGWATAGIIAEGCQTAWIKAAAAGRGPPHERLPRSNFVENIQGAAMRNFGDNRINRSSSSNLQSTQSKVEAWMRDGNGEEEQDDDNDRKFVHTRATARLHWGIGILGQEDDVRPEPEDEEQRWKP